MRNLKVIMAYRGTAYHGFQRQENAITVQQVVEECISKVMNMPIVINGCSRTDAGVHANEFCFSLMTEKQLPARNFIRGVNGYLPEDISILSCEDADEAFHARFSCKAKEYAYLIHNSECKNPFAPDLQYQYCRKLDIDLMRRASRHFIGTHDFKSFCSTGSDKISTVRTIYSFDIENSGDFVKLLVKGDGFLYNMVRIMIGTLLWVNEGKINADEIPQIIEARNRERAGKTAMAHGLYLNRVFY